MTKPPNANKYLQAQIVTASPEQLLLMLYDGALRFLDRAREALKEEKIKDSHDNLVRVQKIVVELMCSLKKEVDPDLTNNLTSLYYYIYQNLVRANMEKDIAKIDEAAQLLSTLRSGWREAVATVQGQRAPTGTAPNYPVKEGPGNSGFSLQG